MRPESQHEVRPNKPLPIIKKTAPRRSGRCAEPPPPSLLTGVAQFNAGDYWHCHETLEELWRPEPDPVRYLYQGLLQVGVGFYHLRRVNYRGAVNKLTSGLGYLAPSAPVCQGIDVARLMREAGEVRALLVAAGQTGVAGLANLELPRVWIIAEHLATVGEDCCPPAGPRQGGAL